MLFKIQIIPHDVGGIDNYEHKDDILEHLLIQGNGMLDDITLFSYSNFLLEKYSPKKFCIIDSLITEKNNIATYKKKL